MKFSVIIPTLNEEDNIAACLAHLWRLSPDVEIIVADGGSTDGTAAKAQAMGAVVCQSAGVRGSQCNAGAAIATGDVLVFLHADTRLPDGAFSRLERLFHDSRVKLGTFGIKFQPDHWFLRFFAFLSRFDPGFFRFGDQCLVMRRSLFHSLGGFPEWNLFEDITFVRRARRVTRIHRFPMKVVTSARRFERNGFIRQQSHNVYLTLLYLLGGSPETLARHYENGTRGATVTIFARFPEPGRVKTRLAQILGDTTAATTYRLCAEAAFQAVRRLPDNAKKYIAYADERDGERIRQWAGNDFAQYPQKGNDLGERLEESFRDMFRRGANRAIALASDVPDISATIIGEAIRTLDRYDVVLGPAYDGGYYLIGTKKHYAALFRGMLWSTPQVLTQTVEAARRLRLTIHQLPQLIDVDTAEDLQRWLVLAREGHPLKTYAAKVTAKLPPPSTTDFPAALAKHGLNVTPMTIETLWANITRQCNQSCRHCHVDASPQRTEQMPLAVIERCLKVLATCDTMQTLDITGGAPELHPHFDYFVTSARRLGKQVVVRHNLTITLDGHPQNSERKKGLPEFFAAHQVKIIASLPHYTRPVTEAVRGEGVFDKSIESIRRLNACGYGVPGSRLILDLVHNHDGPVTPTERELLEARYRTALAKRGVTFNRLLAVTNVPVNRFRQRLIESGKLDTYMEQLAAAFNPSAIDGLVCRTTISVGLNGRLYDCDFNQMADLPIIIDERPASVSSLDSGALLERRIRFAPHCFGCTAGGGSG